VAATVATSQRCVEDAQSVDDYNTGDEVEKQETL